jgi:hypothetical protein
VGSVTGSVLSEFQGGVTHFEATDVRWEVDPELVAGAGWTRYKLVAGQARIWRVVECASYVSPEINIDLATSSFFNRFLFVSDSDAQGPGGEPTNASLWYYGQATVSGIQLLSKVCATDHDPDPDTHLYAQSQTVFQNYNTSGDFEPRPSDDPNVLAGTFTRTGGGLTATWTWHFERVSGGSQ